MKSFLLLVSLLLYSYISFCQPTREVDSLLKSLDTEKDDSHQSSSLHKIGLYYLENNPSKALTYFNRAEVIAARLNDKQRLATIYNDMGLAHLRKHDFDKALNYYQQAARIFEQFQNNERLTDTYISISTVFFWNKNYDKATEYYEKAYANTLQRKDSIQLSNVFAQRAKIYAESGILDSALNYFQKAATISRLAHDDKMQLNTLRFIGITYSLKKETTLALSYFDAVLTSYLHNPETSLLDFAALYNNIANARLRAGNYTEAIAAFNKSNAFAEKGNIPYILMENFQGMSNMYGAMKDYRLQSVYLGKYHAIKDSIFTNDNKNQLTQLEADYQLEKKNISLAKQQAETTKNKHQRNVFIIITIATALLLVTLIFFYRRIRQNNRLLHDQNSQINKQKNELQILNQVKDRLFSVISHDLRNPLVGLKAYLSLADNPSLPEEKREQYRKQTTQAVNHTSDMLDNLLLWANMQVKNIPPAVVSIDIEECIDDAIGAVAAQADQKNITISKNIQYSSAIADAGIVEIALRNLITNAVKYSYDGNTVTISTSADGEHTFIAIKDEGIGMNKIQVNELLSKQSGSTSGTSGEKGSGLGLFLVKELLQKIDAVLLVESESGKGSRFIIKLVAG